MVKREWILRERDEVRGGGYGAKGGSGCVEGGREEWREGGRGASKKHVLKY